jgi:subtilisin family serine protease
MKKSLVLSSLLATTSFLYAAPERCIITFKDYININDIDFKAKKLAKKARGSLKHTYKHAIKGFAIEMPCHAARYHFDDNEDVLSISEDITINAIRKPKVVKRPKNSPRKSPIVEPTLPETPESEEPILSSEEISYGTTKVGGPFNGTGKTAWIVDSGIDTDHPDLNVDTYRAFTVYDSVEDENGHGTHVAGIVGAIERNNIGTVGVAQGATVVPVRVLDQYGSGSLSGIIAGLDYVAQNAKVGECINLSLGAVLNDVLDEAVLNTAQTTGAYITIAAGNDSSDANNYSPARVNGDNIYTISAVGEYDEFAWFSNYGNAPIDYAAPGVDIKSSWLDGKTNTISGTSMAAPHACGVLISLQSGETVSSNSIAIGDNDGFEDPIIYK